MNKDNRSDSLKIVLTGDLFYGGEFASRLTDKASVPSNPFRHISSFLDDADLLLVNFEGPVSTGSEKRTDTSSILSNPSFMSDFFSGQPVFVANLANNHIMDYGADGLQNTVSFLSSRGARYFGAGQDEDDANKALILELKNKKIAFLGFTSDEKHINAIISASHRAGCPTYHKIKYILQYIRELKQIADIVCVSLHWGYEYFCYPSPEQIKLAHSIVDAGADIVAGHHPHVIQGVEKYKNALILYSLGNFFFSDFRMTSGRMHYQKRLAREFMIVTAAIGNDLQIECEFIGGMRDENYLLVPYAADSRKAFLKKIDQLSGVLSIPDYESFWNQYRTRREKELIRESLWEAVQKVFRMSPVDLIKNIKPGDVKRNFRRLIDMMP